MKKCEKCDNIVEDDIRFCSRSCANSRIFNEQSKRKKSEANKKRFLEKGSWGAQINLTVEQRENISIKVIETHKKRILETNFDELSIDSKRKRVLLEQDNKCFECGLSEWRDKKLPLELDHKNGDHSDNNRENLVAICPNCHSLTKTWRGRNKSKDNRWLSDEEIYNLYTSGKNIHQILLFMGFAAKGNNYTRVKRILQKF